MGLTSRRSEPTAVPSTCNMANLLAQVHGSSIASRFLPGQAGLPRALAHPDHVTSVQGILRSPAGQQYHTGCLVDSRAQESRCEITELPSRVLHGLVAVDLSQATSMVGRILAARGSETRQRSFVGSNRVL